MIKYFQDKTFYASNEPDGWFNWMDAKKLCEDGGRRLAAPCNSDQNAAILQLLNTKSYNQFWIGISDNAEEGTWRDVEGNILIYENWAAAFPKSDILKNCAKLRKTSGWKDDECSKPLQYVCEGPSIL